MMALNEAYKDNFRWDAFESPAELGQIRIRVMRQFLNDFSQGKQQGRYVTGELPSLPFPSGCFDLALCSHFLFTYSDQFSTEFHLNAILEMLRAASEIRIFPLLTAFSGKPSPHLPAVMEALRSQKLAVEIRQVDYEFQKGGN